jgi:hypothetical protein
VSLKKEQAAREGSETMQRLTDFMNRLTFLFREVFDFSFQISEIFIQSGLTPKNWNERCIKWNKRQKSFLKPQHKI